MPLSRRHRRTAAENRDIARVKRADDRFEHVVGELRENAETMTRVDRSMLQHNIAGSNFSYFAGQLTAAVAVVKRAVWRMAQRRSYESLARWAETAAATGNAITIDQLRAELARRSTLLDESETEDEKEEREQLDASIAAEVRRTAAVLQPSMAEKIQTLYTTRGMGRR
jgi:hypothetical protein